VRDFAGLLDALIYTRSRNAKLKLVADYLAATPDPDRGWAMAALTGDLDLPGVKPALIRAFPWPKSMRWGGTSSMVWVRPLKRILCVLDGEVVPFTLAQNGDDGHGLASGGLTEGHRIMSPGAYAVRNFAEYKSALAARHVVLEAEDRARMIREGINALAAAEGLEVVPDEGLIAEVAGLVEWPVPLLARIDDAFMDLPPEVMRTTMRVNQRYFALRKPDGSAAPRFALVANIAAPDGGAAIIAGNERVLRARLRMCSGSLQYLLFFASCTPCFFWGPGEQIPSGTRSSNFATLSARDAAGTASTRFRTQFSKSTSRACWPNG
jgi:hypothetical protein